MKDLGDEVTFEVGLPQVLKALAEVMARFEDVTTHEVDLEPVSLEDKVALIRARLADRGRLAWSELFADVRSRIDVIVTFMAMLELAKGGELRLHQADNFSELWVFGRVDAGTVPTAEEAP